MHISIHYKRILPFWPYNVWFSDWSFYHTWKHLQNWLQLSLIRNYSYHWPPPATIVLNLVPLPLLPLVTANKMLQFLFGILVVKGTAQINSQLLMCVIIIIPPVYWCHLATCQAPGPPAPGSRTRRQAPAGAGPGAQQEKEGEQVNSGLSFRYVLSSVTSYTVLLDQTRDMGLHNRWKYFPAVKNIFAY